MKTIEIFEPAMCCSTGVCGPGIDPELLRVSTLVTALTRAGIIVKRFNLSSAPQEFISNKTVSEQLTKNDANILPLTLVDGVIVKTKTYPTNEECAQWTGITITGNESAKKAKSCCCGDKPC